MEIVKKIALVLVLALAFVACKDETKESEQITTEVVEEVVDTIEVIEKPEVKTTKQIKEELIAKGFKTFDYVDEKTQDTILMQQYFMAFLKSGPIRSQNEEEAEMLQEAHLAHLKKMYELGYADISGPFGDDGDIRGITIYNVPTQKMADSLANSDPMVKAGRLIIEIHPWWAAKGFSLR
ncbi:YciI family protein [Aestuariibaculum sp. YM273]|uniref:YciI family protein n=1 Tax=Aestuariibaculum sp. YM273 TaxID=3070659 RepID=UPI0027DCD2C5|nr:YciI family protein [Aestuariibaculum sp. YM273]WMI66797.1 YciI family protein [Aestuariibaculum sp. YM273]